MPFMPLTTETVYTRRVTARIRDGDEAGVAESEEFGDDLAHRRGRQRKSRGCAGQQCEDRHQINQGSGKPVCVFSEDWAAGFGVFLFMAAAHEA